MSCWRRRSSTWRTAALWDGGGRGHEPPKSRPPPTGPTAWCGRPGSRARYSFGSCCAGRSSHRVAVRHHDLVGRRRGGQEQQDRQRSHRSAAVVHLVVGEHLGLGRRVAAQRRRASLSEYPCPITCCPGRYTHFRRAGDSPDRAAAALDQGRAARQEAHHRPMIFRPRCLRPCDRHHVLQQLT